MHLADNLPPSCAVVKKFGSLKFLEPSGPLQACHGTDLPFLDYATRRVQVNRDGLKLNGTHQLLAYADGVNILGGSIHTLKENAETLVAATREIGPEVNVSGSECRTNSQCKD